MKKLDILTERALFGPASLFNAAEQAAMRRGYSRREREAISGKVFGGYPQAISKAHAVKLDNFNFPDWEDGAILPNGRRKGK